MRNLMSSWQRLVLAAFVAVVTLALPKVSLAEKPVVEYLRNEQKANVPLNPKEATAAMNTQLGLTGGVVDSKVLFADGAKASDFTTFFALKPGLDPAKAFVYVNESTAIPDALTQLRAEITNAQLGPTVAVTDFSIISFIDMEMPERTFVAASVSFVITGSDGCRMPMSIVNMMGMAMSGELAGRQHVVAVNFASGDVGSSFPPGTILPSGARLPAALPSAFTECSAALGPRHSDVGLTDPCDKLIAQTLQCLWDERCVRIREGQIVTRKATNGTLIILGGVGGMLLFIVNPPAGCVVLGMIVGKVAFGAASYYAYSEFSEGEDAKQNAGASMNRSLKCLAAFVDGFTNGPCGGF